MKNILPLWLAVAGMVVAFSACKNGSTENNVYIKNTPAVGQPSITYIIQVVDAAGNTDGRAAGLQGAFIKYRNAAGAAKTAQTDAGGNATLTDVAPGSFSGRFDYAGYASMDFTTDLSPSNAGLADSGKQYTGSTRLYAIRSNATLVGRVYGNYSNLPGITDPNAAGNRKQVNLKVSYNLVRTGAGAYPVGAGIGRITDINLDPATVLIQTDDKGDFNVSGLHATKSGYAEATLSMVPFLPDGSPLNTGFVLSQSSNKVQLNLGSAETTWLGNLLAVRP